MTVVTANLTDLIDSAIQTILEPYYDQNIGGRVGIVLSGGLDSSTVAAMSPGLLPTFTGYYDEPGFDERAYAHLVAHDRHYDIKITPEQFVEHFDAIKAALGDLRPGMGAIGQYMVAKFLHDYGIEVAMSGEGSDELFGGYARQMIVAGEAPPVGYEDYVLPDGYPTDLKAALDYDYALLPALLAVDDQMLGAFGIEARAPFTDPRIVEYGLGLPIGERVGKRHLRSRLHGIVPETILNRKDKRGFPVPLVKWANEHPDVRAFVLDKIGYLPDPTKPWDRTFWYAMLDS